MKIAKLAAIIKLTPVYFQIIVIMHVIAIVGLVALLLWGHILWQTWALALGFYLFTMLGITVGYHRLWAHSTYKANRVVQFILLIVGTASLSSSVLSWCASHRQHHAVTDTDEDPHNSKRGFWYSHILWFADPRWRINIKEKKDCVLIKDLMQDPLLRWQDKYFELLAAVTGLLAPTLIAGFFWGQWIEGLVIAGFLRIIVSYHATFLVNSVAHRFGRQLYTLEDESRDNVLVALLTLGEGYHNFHHAFPYDYRNGVALTAFDPTKWFIRLLCYLGLAKELRRATDEQIQKQKQLISLIKKEKSYFLSILEMVKLSRFAVYDFLKTFQFKAKSAYKFLCDLQKQSIDAQQKILEPLFSEKVAKAILVSLRQSRRKYAYRNKR